MADYSSDLERIFYGTILCVKEIITETTPQSSTKPFFDYVPPILKNNYFASPKSDSDRGCNFPQMRFRYADILANDGSRIKIEIPIPSFHNDYAAILQSFKNDADISKFIIHGEFISFQLLRRM
ncbi:MAG: hypothetical protein AAGA60_30980 [Cyanobacteria bacterium P01_E01_bin.42]